LPFVDEKIKQQKTNKMVKLEIKNIKEIDDDAVKEQFTKLCEEKRAYLDKYFTNYGKELTMEVIVNKDGDIYKISSSLNLKSKKILHAEEGKDILAVTTLLMKEFTKEVKRQKELEKKSYVYKRKR
jgi:ribosome-associated translation inhibitor RaiA